METPDEGIVAGDEGKGERAGETRRLPSTNSGRELAERKRETRNGGRARDVGLGGTFPRGLGTVPGRPGCAPGAPAWRGRCPASFPGVPGRLPGHPGSFPGTPARVPGGPASLARSRARLPGAPGSLAGGPPMAPGRGKQRFRSQKRGWKPVLRILGGGGG